MLSVCKKELRQFFSSLTGYIAIIVFLLVNGLMLFVFDNNILDFGYATLDRFFELAPWVLLLLIPAITMRTFSDEFKTGTFELLQTKPLTAWQIVLGKYFGCLTVILIALLPTLVYFFIHTTIILQRGHRHRCHHWILYRVVLSCSRIYSDRSLLQQFYYQLSRRLYSSYHRMRLVVLWIQCYQPVAWIECRR